MSQPSPATESPASLPSKTLTPPSPPTLDVPAEPAFSLPTGEAGAPAVPADRRQSNQPPEGGVERRKGTADRRASVERRVIDIGSPTGLERRRGPGRRRTDDRRSAEEGEMTDEQFEFVLAIDTYKRLNNRPFPTWTEVLEVLKQLGYRKVAASSLSLPAGTGRSRTAPAPGAADLS